MNALHFRKERANRDEVSQGRECSWRRRLSSACASHPSPAAASPGFYVPPLPGRGLGGRYLGGWLPGLNGTQVLVQLGAQLGQLSLQQDLAAGYGGRLGQRGGAGGSAPWGALVKGQMCEAQWAAGQSTRCLGKGQAQGTGPGQAAYLWACQEVRLRVSGGPCPLTKLTHPLLP